MPYRRLPNTDNARIKAMKQAVNQSSLDGFGSSVLSFKIKNEVSTFLNTFEQYQILYKQSFANQVKSNKDYQKVLNNAKMYISHFIQVLNLSVVRGEIKREHKKYYHLELEENSVPDLSVESNILRCGKNIIEGEKNRLRFEGGAPIYNPAIAKVKVYYDQFCEHKTNQKFHKATTNRHREELVKLREKADKIILEIWNEVEEHFKGLPITERLNKCSQYGVKYYYRKNEKSKEN